MTWGKRRILVIGIVILCFIALIWAVSKPVRLESLMPHARKIPFPAGQQPSPDTLASKLSGLTSGSYTIPWQVLAPDGYISRGEIPFTVKNP